MAERQLMNRTLHHSVVGAHPTGWRATGSDRVKKVCAADSCRPHADERSIAKVARCR